MRRRIAVPVLCAAMLTPGCTFGLFHRLAGEPETATKLAVLDACGYLCVAVGRSMPPEDLENGVFVRGDTTKGDDLAVGAGVVLTASLLYDIIHGSICYKRKQPRASIAPVPNGAVLTMRF